MWRLFHEFFAIPNIDFRLRPGMFVRVRIVLSEHKNTQAIPPNAILTRNDQRGVFMIDPTDQTAMFVPVKTGLETRNRVEILSPVFKDNDLIVTVGNHMLETGKEVEISQLSRLHMAENLAAEAKQTEQQQAAGQQPRAVPAESGDKAQ